MFGRNADKHSNFDKILVTITICILEVNFTKEKFHDEAMGRQL